MLAFTVSVRCSRVAQNTFVAEVALMHGIREVYLEKHGEKCNEH